MSLRQALQKLIEVGLLTTHSQTITLACPPQFRMDLHCAYHQGPGYETNRCSFILIPNDEEVQNPYVDVSQTPYVNDVHTSDIQYVIGGGKVVRQQPPTVARPWRGHPPMRRSGKRMMRS
ncbi:hypothetical protein CK203_035721 [Vitis vinifera]|uniref:Uncharacterized protein n=1 Tax=Vitis vinifera TaxID=29760 RepID=A0A438ICS2_VITVI|nr:hypothetical protein CK203_035721 [Vitis vinifera]